MINKAVIRLHVGYRALRDTVLEHERDRGATAVEYALIVSLIAVAIVGVVAALGGTITEIFTTTNDQIQGPGDGGNPPAGG
ncbi:Flp family type IVb pilin [Actinocorallia aurantiaca]|uniref:Pilus assembly protein Flp/PilA n=1 Tax=Actinocorallia aurantiaca TaxID=46204 RepID=A0ABN3U9H0_9ACTN